MTDSNPEIKIICVCGARPNFMKICPLMKALERDGGFDTLLVHTGQHYSKNMSTLFFRELDIPLPDINLDVGSASHAVQTAKIMMLFEPVMVDFKPDYVVVVGDVNSTVACGLVAVKMGVKLVHIEAGQRSGDRTMPEEINRIVTDAISNLLFVSEPSAVDRLLSEGIDSGKICYSGNIMIDNLLNNREKAKNSDILDRLGLKEREYGVLTLHRPGNVDDYARFDTIIEALDIIRKEDTIVFPVHPRTQNNLDKMGFLKRIENMKNIVLTDPLGYLDFLHLMDNARIMLTDSGGIQAETTMLGVPCLTLRNNTEWPITITDGTNQLVLLNEKNISETYLTIMSNGLNRPQKIPKLWDGKAAVRIVEAIRGHSGSIAGN
ncbi:non-hydrolyzing UDP-N-acetylglucosamine 2-epimerase [Candidatus Latescibacterota bacterium]